MTKPAVVLLCGSNRFHAEFRRLGHLFTSRGTIVLAPDYFEQEQGLHPSHAPEEREVLDELHMAKIRLVWLAIKHGHPGYILVVNIGGYVGEHTQREIHYAENIGVPVEYLESR